MPRIPGFRIELKYQQKMEMNPLSPTDSPMNLKATQPSGPRYVRYFLHNQHSCSFLWSTRLFRLKLMVAYWDAFIVAGCQTSLSK